MIPRGVMLSVVAVVVLGGLANTPRRTLVCYDEGVLYYQSVRWADGLQPYRDFFGAQPPGILLIGRASEAVGLGLTGCRLAAWACGVVLLYQTFALGRRLAAGLPDPTAVGLAAAMFVALAHSFIFAFTEGANTTPAACLSVYAVQLALTGRAGWAGVVLGLATVFRVQPVIVVPAVAIIVLCLSGRAGVGAVFRLGVAFGLVAAAVQGGLAALVPGYADCVFGFQAGRPRADLGYRLGQVLSVVAQPQVGVSVVAVAAAVRATDPAVRGVAIAAAFLLLATTFAANSLYYIYYLPTLPLAAAVGAVAVGRLDPRVSWTGVTVAVLFPAGLVAIDRLAQERRDIAPAAEYLQRIADLPGRTVLTEDATAAVWAGKRGVPDFYATDPNALYQFSPARFGEWVEKVLPTADGVAVSERFADWLPPAGAQAVRASGKPVAFESPAAEKTFTTKQQEP